MRQPMFSLLENWLAWCGYQDRLPVGFELFLSLPEWLRELTLCQLAALRVSGFFDEHILQFFFFLWTNTHSQTGARNLIVENLARVTVESTTILHMAGKAAEYRTKARSVQLDYHFMFSFFVYLRSHRATGGSLNYQKFTML